MVKIPQPQAAARPAKLSSQAYSWPAAPSLKDSLEIFKWHVAFLLLSEQLIWPAVNPEYFCNYSLMPAALHWSYTLSRSNLCSSIVADTSKVESIRFPNTSVSSLLEMCEHVATMEGRLNPCLPVLHSVIPLSSCRGAEQCLSVTGNNRLLVWNQNTSYKHHFLQTQVQDMIPFLLF